MSEVGSKELARQLLLEIFREQTPVARNDTISSIAGQEILNAGKFVPNPRRCSSKHAIAAFEELEQAGVFEKKGKYFYLSPLGKALDQQMQNGMTYEEALSSDQVIAAAKMNPVEPMQMVRANSPAKLLKNKDREILKNAIIASVGRIGKRWKEVEPLFFGKYIDPASLNQHIKLAPDEIVAPRDRTSYPVQPEKFCPYAELPKFSEIFNPYYSLREDIETARDELLRDKYLVAGRNDKNMLYCTEKVQTEGKGRAALTRQSYDFYNLPLVPKISDLPFESVANVIHNVLGSDHPEAAKILMQLRQISNRGLGN